MDDKIKLRRATYHLWTFTTSKLISSFGAQVYAFAISFYILQSTGSATSFAANLICNILPRTLAAPFAGYLVDKYSRKAIVVIAQIAATTAIGGLLFVSFRSGLSLPAIYITSCILSLTSMFSGVTFTSSITGLVDQERVQRAMSLNQISVAFASIASPAIGGILYSAVSMPVFLIMYITASIFAVILESTMNFKLFANRKEKLSDEPKESMWQNMKAGISYLRLRPLLMTIIWISLLLNFLFSAFEVGYSFILIDKLKMASKQFGFTEGSFAIGMLLMSIYFSIRKEVNFPLLVSKRAILGLGAAMGAIAVPLMFHMASGLVFSYYLVLMFSFGALVIITNTPIQVVMQKQIDDDYKGRVFSILETMAMALVPLGMVIFGFLFDVFPSQWILLVSGGSSIVVVLVLARPSVIKKVHPELERGNSVPGGSSVV